MNRNRLLLLAAALGAAALLAVVLILVTGKSKGTTATTTTTTTSATATTSAAATDPFAGIPQHGDTLGRANAPVTLTVYEDPQCPFCRQWDLESLPTVVNDYLRTGKIKLVYRGILIVGPNSELGLRAIYAAGTQNKLWNVGSTLYQHQGAENSGWITPGLIEAVAAETGADGKAILAQLNAPAVTAALKQAEQQAASAGIRGTPSFVVERPPALPQQLSLSALDAASFGAALAAALQ